MNKSGGGVRWWLLLVIVVLILGALAWAWFINDASSRQRRVVTTQGILTTGGIGLFLWLAWLSRLSVRARVCTVLVLLLGVGGFFTAFRYAGVDGDLVPVFVPRWRAVQRVVTGAALTGVAGDFPQFGGAGRDGRVSGIKLARDWDAAPPVLVWRRPVGEGWSGFAVVSDLAVTQEQHDDEERVVCYDLATGDVVWSHADDAAFSSALGGVGPRATPTIRDDRVYSLGATGILNAFELRSGRHLWSADVVAESDGKVVSWGMSGSPLVHDGKVIVGTGGADGRSLAAYDAASGKRVWAGGDDVVGYSSPTLLDLAGVPQIVMFNAASVAGHHPSDGRVLWSHPWRARQPNIAQPLPVGDGRLIASSGYGVGSELLELSPKDDGSFDVATVWSSRRMKSKFASMILHEGHVFGLDDGILACIDLESGARSWKGGRYGHGQLLFVDDVLLVMAEDGDVVLVEPNVEKHAELTRFEAIDGKVWNPPALAGSRLLVRNEREAALFLLPVR